MANSTAKFLNWITPQSYKTADKQYVGIGGFRLFVELLADANFTATAPDVVCEDLTTAQDSIVNQPKTLTITGEVADIFIENEIESGFGTVLETVLNDLTPYIPQKTMSQIQKIEEFANDIDNTIQRIDNAIGGASSIIDTLQGREPSKSIKEQFFDAMERYYDTKQPMTVDSLYRTYENYVMTSFSFSENNNGDPSDFVITLKELRIVSIDLFRNDQLLNDADKAKVNVNTTLDGQLDSVTDKGASQGLQVPNLKSMEIIERLYEGN